MLNRALKKLRKVNVGQLSLKNALLFSVTNFAQFGFALLSASILARTYTKEEYGLYVSGMLYFTTISTLAKYGLDRTLVRDLNQSNKPNAYILSGSLLIFLISMLSLVVVIAATFLDGSTSESQICILLFSIAGLIWAVSPTAWFDYLGEMQLQSKYVLIERTMFFITILTVLWIFGLHINITYFAAIFLAYRALMFVFEWRYLMKTVGKAEVPIWGLMLTILRENIWVFLAVISSMMLTQFNQFVLQYRGGLTEFTYFAISFQLVNILRLLQRQMMRLNINEIALQSGSLNGQSLIHVVNKKVVSSLRVSLLAGIPAVIFSPLLIKLIFGLKYMDATLTLRILFLWMSFYGLGLIMSQFLLGLKADKLVFRNTSIIGVVCLVVSYFVSHKYGAAGAALVLLIGHLLLILWQYLQIRHLANKSIDFITTPQS